MIDIWQFIKSNLQTFQDTQRKEYIWCSKRCDYVLVRIGSRIQRRVRQIGPTYSKHLESN